VAVGDLAGRPDAGLRGPIRTPLYALPVFSLFSLRAIRPSRLGQLPSLPSMTYVDIARHRASIYNRTKLGGHAEHTDQISRRRPPKDRCCPPDHAFPTASRRWLNVRNAVTFRIWLRRPDCGAEWAPIPSTFAPRQCRCWFFCERSTRAVYDGCVAKRQFRRCPCDQFSHRVHLPTRAGTNYGSRGAPACRPRKPDALRPSG